MRSVHKCNAAYGCVQFGLCPNAMKHESVCSAHVPKHYACAQRVQYGPVKTLCDMCLLRCDIGGFRHSVELYLRRFTVCYCIIYWGILFISVCFCVHGIVVARTLVVVSYRILVHSR